MVDELSRRLAAYESDLMATLQLAPVETVRARGGRRRAHTYAAALAAVLGVVIAGAAVAAGGRVNDGTRAGDAPAGWLSSEELDQVRLPHEGEPRYVLWVGIGAPSALQPCTGWTEPVPYAAVADPTRIGRVAARTVTVQPDGDSSRPGRSTVLASQMLLFTSADVAAGALRELVDGASACGWLTQAGATVEDGAAGSGGYTWLAAQRSLAGDDETKMVEAALAFRTGNAVAVVYTHEVERADAPLGAAAGAAMAELISRLCPIVLCDPYPLLLSGGFPSLNPPQTYGPSREPSPVPPYPSSSADVSQPPSETPPIGGASPS
jgi:hypothetical protein